MRDIYRDMAERTGGDIYIAVAGPVRTGKSTFIKRFSELLLLPNMDDDYDKERLVDELPQSGAGRSIMTTQPRFVPAEAVNVTFEEGVSCRCKLIDCVGYMVPGAVGDREGESPRMVTTPWFDHDIPFSQAAEVGTTRVIQEHATIPDNCKVAVTQNSDWINPTLNKEFQAWAAHNGTVILPAKVKSPRWKPVVEGHVKLVTMHILVDMDEMTFYSLEELNAVLWEKMDRENRINLANLSYSRKDLFEKEEKDALQPLPESQYEYLVRKIVTVNPDFSFVYDSVHYSMPRKYLKKQLEIRAGDTKIYVYNSNGDLIRTHERSYTPKSWVVIPSDMPKEYSDYSYWNTPYFLKKAEQIGPNTRALIQRVIEKYDYPVQSYRSCFGILRFAEKYGNEALEACCKSAILYGKCSYNYVSTTVSSFVTLEKPLNHKVASETVASFGEYKDDDSQYSLENLLKKQEVSHE